MKFAIIIPVYNVEKYIERCLDSVLKQSYTNYEVLVINDGSPANEQPIIDKYVKKDNRIKSYIKKNGGLSDARNYGVKNMSKDIDYIFFLDSDDYIEKDLLKTLNKYLLNNKVDALKFRAVYVDEDGNYMKDAESVYFDNFEGADALIKLIEKDPIFMTAWSYVYKKTFWLENNFEYPFGRIHEDIALTPLVLAKASYVSSINYVGYNYVQRENSIMSQVSEEKLIKKADDTKANLTNLLVQLDSLDISEYRKKTITHYFARVLIHHATNIKSTGYYTEYVNSLRNLNLYRYMKKGRFRGRLEYIMIKCNLKLYLKIIG